MLKQYSVSLYGQIIFTYSICNISMVLSVTHTRFFSVCIPFTCYGEVPRPEIGSFAGMD